MGKYHVHRSDANAEAIYGWLERHGASVARSGRPTDAIVGFAGFSVVVEVKTPKGKLERSQEQFLMTWRGAAAVLRCNEDANELLKWMQKCADFVPDAVLNTGTWMATRDIRGVRT